jgi:RNA polymerase sigma-70 factor (ECF subfamily)
MKPTDSRFNQGDYLLADTSAFQSLFNQRHIAVFRFIYGLLGGPNEEVEDLTMKTFLQAWRARSRFQGNEDAAFRWLLTIARNLVIDHYRRKSNQQIHLDIETQSLTGKGKTPEEIVFQLEQTRTLWMIIETLPSLHREMIVLRYILGWRVKDIGNHLEINENLVSVTIRRILKQIKDKWPEHE